MRPLIEKHLNSGIDEIDEKDFMSLVDARETNFVEAKSLKLFKKDDHVKKALGKAVSAFANYEGGVILIGVDDVTKEIEKGIPDKNEKFIYSEWLSQIVGSCTSPTIKEYCVKRLVREKRGEICLYAIFVDQSEFAPVASRVEKKFYERTDKSTVAIRGSRVHDIFTRKRDAELSFLLEFDFAGVFKTASIKITPYVEVQNNIIAEDCRIVATSFAQGQITEPRGGYYDINENKVNRERTCGISKNLIYPDEQRPFEPLIIHLKASDNIREKVFEFSVYARNAKKISQAFTLIYIPKERLKLYEFPVNDEQRNFIKEYINFQDTWYQFIWEYDY